MSVPSIDFTKVIPSPALHEQLVKSDQFLLYLQQATGDDEEERASARAVLERFEVNLTHLDSEDSGVRVQNMVQEAARGDAKQRKAVSQLFRNPLHAQGKPKSGNAKPATPSSTPSSANVSATQQSSAEGGATQQTPPSATEGSATQQSSTSTGGAASQGSHDNSPGDTQDSVTNAATSQSTPPTDSSNAAPQGATINDASGNSENASAPTSNAAPQGATPNDASGPSVNASASNTNAAPQGATSTNNGAPPSTAARGRGAMGGRGSGATVASPDRAGKTGEAFADRGRGGGTRGGTRGGRGAAQSTAGGDDARTAEQTALDHIKNAPSLATTLVPQQQQTPQGQWSNGAPQQASAKPAPRQAHYNGTVSRQQQSEADSKLNYCCNISQPVRTAIGVETDTIPFAPTQSPAEFISEGSKQDTFVVGLHAAFESGQTILANDQGNRKQWLLHGKVIYVVWCGPQTRFAIVVGVGKDVVPGNIDTRTQYLDIDSGEPVPIEARKGYSSAEHCLVQGSVANMTKLATKAEAVTAASGETIHLETRRLLTNHGPTAIVEAESSKVPARDDGVLVMRMFSLTSATQGRHRARLRIKMPTTRDKGKVSDSFRQTVLQAALALQSHPMLGDAEVLMMGNDLLVWTPKPWDRQMKAAVESFDIVKSCYTEARIVGVVPSIHPTSASSEIASVVSPVANDVAHVWGTVLEGVASKDEWLTLLGEIGGVPEVANGFHCRFTIPIVKWAALTNERYCNRGWCRLSLNQPMQMVA